MCEKPRFKIPCNSQHPLPADIEFQNVCLSTSKFLLVLFNTLTADEKYSLYNKKNLLQPIQLQLSKKQKICSQFFHGYLKCTSNFEHF